MTLQKYNVTGMSCAACQARVEKAVNKVPGVESAAVSLLTNSMGVEGAADPAEVIRAVERAGYGCTVSGGSAEAGALHPASAESAAVDRLQAGSAANAAAAKARIREQETALEDRETPALRRRLIASVCVLLLLMYGSMGHMMWGWPLPAFFQDNHIAMGIAQMILAAVIMMINGRFFSSGFRSLLHLAPNMDTLVAMGSMTSFVWSVIVLFKMTADQLAGNTDAVMEDMHSFYFESAAIIVTLITVGKVLEAMSKGRTTDALKSLLALAPQTAVVERPDGTEQKIPIEQLVIGDVFVVRPGESIPVDGEIIEGTAAVNEAALTGESVPVDKNPGDSVSAGTVNESGYFRARASRVGEDTTLAQIIRMVSDAAATKAPVAKVADRVSGVFVPVVIGIAAAVIVIWLLAGADTGYALARGISVLVISCPCALGLATPVAIMVGNGLGARNGILFKTAASLEEAGKTQIIALDKTGTITRGEPVVTDLIPAEGVTESGLLRFAAALEERSEHPFARAILKKAEEDLSLQIEGGVTDPSDTEVDRDRDPAIPEDDKAMHIRIEQFRVLPGNGLEAMLSCHEDEPAGKLIGGSLSYVSAQIRIPDQTWMQAEGLSEAGKTPLLFALDERLLGVIAVADSVKDDSAEAIRQLRNMGIHVVMITGDNEVTAGAIAEQVGVDEVIAGVLPSEKDAEIQRLASRGRTAMVGDGINDAPALTRADTGIAIGAGTDVAIEAADIVLMNSRISDVAAAIRLSRATLRNIHENLFWAFIYNILLIPLAAGAYSHLMGGWSVNPMICAAAMSLSSFCVCMNALRLNLLDIHDPGKDKPLREKKAPATACVKNDIDPEECVEELKESNAGTMEEKKEETKEENNDKENTIMKKTMNIEGMMCPHCEAAVKKALEALDGVSEAAVSHEAGTAIVDLTSDVSSEVLTKAVEEKDYKVLSVE